MERVKELRNRGISKGKDMKREKIKLKVNGK